MRAALAMCSPANVCLLSVLLLGVIATGSELVYILFLARIAPNLCQLELDAAGPGGWSWTGGWTCPPVTIVPVPALRGGGGVGARNVTFRVVKVLQDVSNVSDAAAAPAYDGLGFDSYPSPAAAEHFEGLLKASVAKAATMLDASVAALRSCGPGTRRHVRDVFGRRGPAACAPLARNLTLLRRGCLDRLRLVLDLRAGAEAADTIAYVRRYELLVRRAPTHVYSAIAVTRRFLLGRGMNAAGRATTLVHECAHTILDAEARQAIANTF